MNGNGSSNNLAHRPPAPWGWEIPATFVDDAGDEHNKVLLFRDGEPSQGQIDEMAAFWIAKIEAVEEVEIEPET